MSNFKISLTGSDLEIRKLLKENKDLANLVYPVKNLILLSSLSFVTSTYPAQFEEWLVSLNIPKQLEEKKKLIDLKKTEERLFLEKESVNKLKLKRGVLSLGSFLVRDIHVLLNQLGVKESDPGYYVLALYLMESPHIETLNHAYILSNYKMLKK